MDVTELVARNRQGERIGLPSFCTANEHVLEAILDYVARRDLPVLIEATCNQVNQEGGYTGMRPAEFAAWVQGLAAAAGLPADRLMLGGDHLGPNPWRSQSAESAMDKAETMVRDYALAGFRKLHLDASMACGGDALPSFADVAGRAARLCRVAEQHAPDPSALIYVIGTEVPVPGGETDDMAALQVTRPDRLDETVATHREAFRDAGVEQAWGRVVSVVTQPGVDFSHSSVHRFDPDAAAELVAAIGGYPQLTFEGHSTDYQPTAALGELVDRHVFFLKVGPELTFRFREAVFSLADVEEHVCPGERSGVIEALDAAMDRAPEHWNGYYNGTPSHIALLRHYSLSDRIRYYWPDPDVREAVARLFGNLANVTLPIGLMTQHFGELEFGALPQGPSDLCRRHVQLAVSRYYEACGLT